MSQVRTLSVIVPSGDADRAPNLERLLDDLTAQSRPPDEVEVVRGITPSGRARNLGVSRTTGDVLVFLDDDVRLGTTQVLSTLLAHLSGDAGLGMVGTAQLLPPGSTRFQQRCARQIPRSQSAVVDILTESDMVTTACCAIRREVLAEVGGFHDEIRRGVDPELRLRLRAAGYRIAVVPRAWHHHPMPDSLPALLRIAWRNGAASAHVRRHFPESVLLTPEGHVANFPPRVPLATRVLGRGLMTLGLLARCQWFGALYGLAYGLGNAVGPP